MENASKALIMAGSVLMAIMVISLFMVMYDGLKSIEQTKTDNDRISKMADYISRFEEYDRTIYGSELFSLVNLIEDYNNKFNNSEGYEEIEIYVTIKNTISGEKYFENGKNIKLDKILEDKNNIEKDIEDLGDTKYFKSKGKTIKYYSQLTLKELIYSLIDDKILKKNIIYDAEKDTEDEIKGKINEALGKFGNKEEFTKVIDNYKNINSTYKQFKNSKFKCEIISDDNTNRVKSIKVEQL